jgi:hypothetical protein
MTIGKPREAVMIGLVCDLHLLGLELGVIAEDRDEMPESPRSSRKGRWRATRDTLRALATIPDFNLPVPFLYQDRTWIRRIPARGASI